jgi:nuclear receptor subfamily 5 group A protein 3
MYKRDRARKLQVMRQRQAIGVHHVIAGSNNGGSNSNPSPGSIAYTMSSPSSSLYTPPTLHIKQEIQIPQVTSMTSSPGSSPGDNAIKLFSSVIRNKLERLSWQAFPV